MYFIEGSSRLTTSFAYSLLEEVKTRTSKSSDSSCRISRACGLMCSVACVSWEYFRCVLARPQRHPRPVTGEVERAVHEGFVEVEEDGELF